MSNKLTAALAAGAILIGAALVFSFLSTPSPAVAQEETPEVAPWAFGLLQRVLDELVAEGTIGEEDAEAVMTAVEEEIQELREEHPDFHPRRHLLRKGFRFGALLDDGGITQEEYDSLPEPSRLRHLELEAALDDGLITPQELRQAWRAHQEAKGEPSR